MKRRNFKIKCLLVISVLISLNCLDSFSQSKEIMIKAYYFKAKDLFQNGNYGSVMEYLDKCTEQLGGTNEQIQFLYVMSLYKLKKYVAANRELVEFFETTDNNKRPNYYKELAGVEKMKPDEMNEILRVTVDIQEKTKNTCIYCEGTGRIIVEKYECEECNGTGKTKCTHCNGKGSVKCEVCKGKGYLKYTDYHGVSQVVKCPQCDAGYGLQKCPYCIKGKVECQKCEGLGYYRNDNAICPHCGGDGLINN